MRTLCPRLATALLICLLVSAARVVHAQQASSRAEEEARQQQEKARKLAPPRQTFVERQLIAFEETGTFTLTHGLLLAFGDIKTGSGIALGPAYRKMFGSGAVLHAKAGYSLRQFKVAQVALQGPPLGGGRLVVRGRVRWQDAPAGAVYPLGSDSPRQRSDYAERKTEVGADAVFRPVRLVRFTGGSAYEAFVTGPSDSKLPSADAIQPTLPGLFADPHYVHSQISAALDSRTGPGYSRKGSLLQATLHDYHQVNASSQTGSYSFHRVDGAAEQYVPLLHGNWVLYFGLRASTTTNVGGDQTVPFFLMPDLGGPKNLRGYFNYRFRDRHSLVATAEYRWYIQEYVEGAVFYDAGKVTPTRGDLDFSHLKDDVGIGFRVHSSQSTFLRLEVGRSNEGVRFVIAFTPIGG